MPSPDVFWDARPTLGPQNSWSDGGGIRRLKELEGALLCGGKEGFL